MPVVAALQRRISQLARGALWLVVSLWITQSVATRAQLAQAIERIKPSVVGVGTYQKLRNPAIEFRGTGFVVADGLHIITNSHVIPPFIDADNKETLIVLIGRGTNAQQRDAERVTLDADHDVALLRIKGTPLPPVNFGDSREVREGETYAFTGFPIGAVLGLYPATHHALISAITPIVIPKTTSRQLDPRVLNRLRNPFEVFQLDGTAYPGNSGSPLFHPDSGLVVGVVNMVFVKGTKESALEDPSGISYAIPSSYIVELLNRAGLKH
jgi:serine protease Do